MKTFINHLKYNLKIYSPVARSAHFVLHLFFGEKKIGLHTLHPIRYRNRFNKQDVQCLIVYTRRPLCVCVCLFALINRCNPLFKIGKRSLHSNIFRQRNEQIVHKGNQNKCLPQLIFQCKERIASENKRKI